MAEVALSRQGHARNWSLKSRQAEVTHVLIDAGGFLGIGSRTVAIDLAEVDMELQAEGELRLNLDMTKSDIENLPEFGNLCRRSPQPPTGPAPVAPAQASP